MEVHSRITFPLTSSAGCAVVAKTGGSSAVRWVLDSEVFSKASSSLSTHTSDFEAFEL